MSASTLFDLSDDAILQEARRIMAERHAEAQALTVSETDRLFRKYARKRASEPHDLGRPKPLSKEEALLLVALERNRYIVEGEKMPNDRWNGDATCQYRVRDGAIVIGAESRRDLLLGIWAAVSDQGADGAITLTEAHLNGALVQRHIRELRDEVKRQESEPDEE